MNDTSYVNGRAPIIDWQVVVTVKNDLQLKHATEWLIENKADYDIKFHLDSSGNHTETYISVTEFPWAHRMKDFAEHLEKCDFDYDASSVIVNDSPVNQPQWPAKYLEAEMAFAWKELNKFYEVDTEEWREAHRDAVLRKREHFEELWIVTHGDWRV